MRTFQFLLILSLTNALSSCATLNTQSVEEQDKPFIDYSSRAGSPNLGKESNNQSDESNPQSGSESVAQKSEEDTVFGKVPRIGPKQNAYTEEISRELNLNNEGVEVSLTTSQPILEFIDVVFGDILQTGYSLGPGVDENPGVINLRTPPVLTPVELFELAKNTLELHGVRVSVANGEVRIFQEEQLRQSAPRFIQSRSRASVPPGLQPVVQFVEIYARNLNEMADILKSAFPDSDDLVVEVNRSSNSLTLSGLNEDVLQALRIVEQMDELAFADTEYAVFSAANWNVTELGQVLEQILQLNGFSVTSQEGVTASINIKPIEYTNQLYLFARKSEFLDYALSTARDLDADARIEKSSKTRVYKVKHYKAEDLVAVLNRLSTQIDTLNALNAELDSQSRGESLSEQDPASSGSGGQFVVDVQGNRIIYTVDDERNAEIVQLLKQIDTPASEVLIEVSIAEVTLTDDLRSGVELLFNQIGSTGYSIGFGTLGGLGLNDGGFSGRYVSGDYVVDFSALASNNQVNVLSVPRIVTKSGASASIQVGTDVPIISSQSAGSSQVGGTTDILQTVEYRETGILLDITPLVLSNDRIDLDN